LTRLAVHLGAEPRSWIDAAGIPWDESIRQVVERTVHKLSERVPRRVSAVAPRGKTLERIRRVVDRGRQDPVGVGIVDLRPFSDPLASEGSSFFHAYVQGLVAALEPAWEIRARLTSAADLADELTSPSASLDIGAGLFDCVHLRARGLEFLPLPGWRIRLDALRVARAGGSERSPSWEELISSSSADRSTFVVPEATPAASYLRGPCGVPLERLLVRRSPSAEQLAEDLLAEVSRAPEHAMTFVADEETCRRVRAQISRLDGFPRAFAVQQVPAAADHRPRYQLAIAVRADEEQWRALLDRAWRQELFGASLTRTARLYAGVMAAGALALDLSTGARAPEIPSNVRPVHFTEAGAQFQREVCRHLPTLLAVGSTESDRLQELARQVVPEEWIGAFEQETAAAAERGAATAPAEAPEKMFCQSCSTSLAQFPGPSPRYCRYCSDEEGHLRPREEVHELIAEWMRHWQEGLSHEESLDRAARFMSTMPAWAEN
jgi:hypothetical protein